MNLGIRSKPVGGTRSRRSRGSLGWWLILAVIGFGAMGRAAGADGAAQFDSANKLYEQGKFAEAVTVYQRMIQAGEISPAVYFNLGNAFFKSGKTGEAVAAYRQAERLAPRDPDLRANLEFVRDEVQGPTLQPAWWQKWLAALTPNEWAMLASGFFWLWLVILAVGQVWPGWKQPLRHWRRLGAAATLILGLGLAADVWMNSVPTAIVIVPDAMTRTGPLADSPNAFAVHDGAELRVLDEKDGWVEVAAQDRVGWLEQGKVIETGGPT